MRVFPVWLVALMLAISGCTDGEDKDDAPDDGANDPVDGANQTVPMTYLELAVDFKGPYPVAPKFDPSTLSAPTNVTVNLTFTNNDQAPVLNSHDWVLEGVTGADTETTAPGASATVSFLTPAPGTYAFFCSVPGHRDNGMEGAFTVTA